MHVGLIGLKVYSVEVDSELLWVGIRDVKRDFFFFWGGGGGAGGQGLLGSSALRVLRSSLMVQYSDWDDSCSLRALSIEVL